MAHSKSRSSGQSYKQFRENMRLGSGFGYSPNIGDVTETSPQRTVQMILNMTQDAVSALIRNVIDETLNQQRDIVVAAQSFGDPANKDVQADIAQRVALYEVLQVRELIIKFPVGYLIPSDTLPSGCDFKWITVAAAKVLGYSCVTGYKDNDNFLVLRNIQMATTMSSGGCCCGSVAGGTGYPPPDGSKPTNPIDPVGNPPVMTGPTETTQKFDLFCTPNIATFAGTNARLNQDFGDIIRGIIGIITLNPVQPYSAFVSSGYDLKPQIDAAIVATGKVGAGCTVESVQLCYAYLCNALETITVGPGKLSIKWQAPYLQIFDKSVPPKVVQTIQLPAIKTYTSDPVGVVLPVDGVDIAVDYVQDTVEAPSGTLATSIGNWQNVSKVALLCQLLPTSFHGTLTGDSADPVLDFHLNSFTEKCDSAFTGDWTPQISNFVAGATQPENVLWDDKGIGVRARLAGPSGITLSGGVTTVNGFISVTNATIDFFYGFVYPSSSGYAKVEFAAGDLTAGTYTYIFRAQLLAQPNGIHVGFGFIYPDNVSFDVQETFSYVGFNGSTAPVPQVVPEAYKPFEVAGSLVYTDLTKKLAVFANGSLGFGAFRHLYISLKKVS